MAWRLRQDRRFGTVLVVVTLMHGLLLLIPGVRHAVFEPDVTPVVTVQLNQPTEPPAPVTEPKPEPPPLQPIEPIELADLPEPSPAPEAEPAPEPEPVEPAPPTITAHRIISSMIEQREEDPLYVLGAGKPAEQPDYYVRYRPALNDVLNEPSVQLPFRDTRIYLVNHYDDGLMGGMQKFWDDVTVPFGFTTRNNTRVQCAWILVIAGCAWGDASLFYAAERAKKRKPAQM